MDEFGRFEYENQNAAEKAVRNLRDMNNNQRRIIDDSDANLKDAYERLDRYNDIIMSKTAEIADLKLALSKESSKLCNAIVERNLEIKTLKKIIADLSIQNWRNNNE